MIPVCQVHQCIRVIPINDKLQVGEDVNARNLKRKVFHLKTLTKTMKVQYLTILHSISYYSAYCFKHRILSCAFLSNFILIYHSHDVDLEDQPIPDDNNLEPGDNDNQDDTLNYDTEDYNRDSGEETGVIKVPCGEKPSSFSKKVIRNTHREDLIFLKADT